jgi:hypothetical protein
LSITYQKPPFLRLTGWLKEERAECGLHPLIHTSPPKTLAQDGGAGQEEAEFKVCHINFE